jgi:hypothetical protein
MFDDRSPMFLMHRSGQRPTAPVPGRFFSCALAAACPMPDRLREPGFRQLGHGRANTRAERLRRGLAERAFVGDRETGDHRLRTLAKRVDSGQLLGHPQRGPACRCPDRPAPRGRQPRGQCRSRSCPGLRRSGPRWQPHGEPWCAADHVIRLRHAEPPRHRSDPRHRFSRPMGRAPGCRPTPALTGAAWTVDGVCVHDSNDTRRIASVSQVDLPHQLP